MPRLLIFLLLAYLCYAIGKQLARIIALHIARKKAQSTRFEPKNSVQNVVKCTRCGTHVPEHDTVLIDGLPVCKEACKA